MTREGNFINYDKEQKCRVCENVYNERLEESLDFKAYFWVDLRVGNFIKCEWKLQVQIVIEIDSIMCSGF